MKGWMIAAAIAAAACGCVQKAELGASVKASSFGFDPADSTVFLQKALDSDCPKIVVDRQPGGWNARPLVLRRADLELVLEPGVVIRAKKGAFVDGHDTLLSVEAGASNVVIRGGAGSGFAMNKPDYADRSRYAFSTHRHALALRHCRNVTVRDLTGRDRALTLVYALPLDGTDAEYLPLERAQDLATARLLPRRDVLDEVAAFGAEKRRHVLRDGRGRGQEKERTKERIHRAV